MRGGVSKCPPACDGQVSVVVRQAAEGIVATPVDEARGGAGAVQSDVGTGCNGRYSGAVEPSRLYSAGSVQIPSAATESVRAAVKVADSGRGDDAARIHLESAAVGEVAERREGRPGAGHTQRPVLDVHGVDRDWAVADTQGHRIPGRVEAGRVGPGPAIVRHAT